MKVGGGGKSKERHRDADEALRHMHGTEIGRVIKTRTESTSGNPGRTLSYQAEKVVGNGSFGVVFLATCLETKGICAIKKVLQDKRFKNRELQIMKMLNHPNICHLEHHFYSNGEKAKDEVYLNLVLEYVQETVYRTAKQYAKQKQRMPIVYVKLYMYQLCRALAYIHAKGICHRDIKPQNLLVDPSKHVLKLCDFGSAKQLVPGEPNISYICSRYYRAPELIFGATDYTPAIDVWSMGCVCAELILGQPLFPGESGVDQLVEIIKVLGTPTREQINLMNPHYTDFKFPQIRQHSWDSVFPKNTPADAIDFIDHVLVYPPRDRLSAIEACAHHWFDELRDPSFQLPDKSPTPVPPLFNFTEEEAQGVSKVVLDKLVPHHMRELTKIL